MFTKAMIEEYLKCEKDFYYFGSKYLEMDFSKFKLPENKFKKYICARQVGKTEFLVAYSLWQSIFTSNNTTLYLTPRHNISVDCMRKFNNQLEKVQSFFQVNIIRQTSLDIHFENGSRIMFRVANNNAGRGMAISTLIMDEAAYFDNLKDILISLYPVIASSPNSKILLATTPSGNNGNMDALDLIKFEEQIIRSNLSPERLEQIKLNIGKEYFDMEFLGGINWNYLMS